MIRGDWYGVIRLKVRVNRGTLLLIRCWHDTDYRLCTITLKLHTHVVKDKDRNTLTMSYGIKSQG